MPMKTIEGYSKEKYTNTSVLLAGGGAKALSDFIGSLSWDSTNKKIKYTPVGGSTTDLVTLSWDNIANKPTSLPANGGNADTSNRAKFLETFQQNSTTNTYGSQYPIWAQWSDSTNVRLKCTNYTVWTDKADNAINADKLDGQHGSRYTSALGGSNYVTFTVEGDANTYYPVVITNMSDYYPMQLVNISRAYFETAPDTWNTSTHRGGLTLTLLWNGSRYWDGNTSGGACYCVYHTESYSTMVGGLGNSTGGKVVWLRGGGAVYHIHSMNGTSTIVTVHTSTYTDSASQSFAPKTSPERIIVRWPGYAEGADYASSAGSVAWSNVTGKPFNWSGQSGQPTWLWGSNDGINYYVWNPSNFKVNYANSAGNASTALLLGLNTNPSSTVKTAVGSWTPIANKEYVYRQKWTNSAAGSDTADLSIYLDGNLTANMCLDGYYFSLLGFKKDGSSDSYVLLGGGGHKALSDFSMAHSHPYLSFSSIWPTNITNLNDYFSSDKMYSIRYDYARSSNIQNGPYESDAGAVINFPTYSGTQVYFNYYNNDVKIRTHYNGHITNWDTFITSSNWSSYISIPSVGNGTVTVTQAGSTIGSFTMNQSGNTLIALNDTNTNYYPIRSYTTGLQISSGSGSTDCALFVPYATNAIAGAVSTAAQSFAGQKTFLNGIKVGSTSGDQSTDNAKIYFGDGKYVWIGESPQDDALMLNCGTGKNIYFSFAGSTAVTSSNYSTYAKIYMSNSGAVYASSGFYESSDERLKKVVDTIKVNLDDLAKLRKIYYLWNNTPEDGRQLGMIAQDVQKLYPELVSMDKNTGYLSLAYDKLSVIALEAIDTLYEEYKQLKERMNGLEKLLRSKEIL